jgi:hypothetical protein
MRRKEWVYVNVGRCKFADGIFGRWEQACGEAGMRRR